MHTFYLLFHSPPRCVKVRKQCWDSLIICVLSYKDGTLYTSLVTSRLCIYDEQYFLLIFFLETMAPQRYKSSFRCPNCSINFTIYTDYEGPQNCRTCWFQMFTFCCRLNFPSRFWKQNAVSTVLSLYKKQYNFKCKISDIFAIHQIKIRIDYQNWNQSYHHRATNLKKIERMSVIDWWHAYFQCKYCRRCYDKFSSRKGMQHPCAFCYTMNTAYMEVGVKNKDNWEREKIFFCIFLWNFC